MIIYSTSKQYRRPSRLIKLCCLRSAAKNQHVMSCVFKYKYLCNLSMYHYMPPFVTTLAAADFVAVAVAPESVCSPSLGL